MQQTLFSGRRRPDVSGDRIRRILMYSHDSYGLGHFRRNLSIAERILELDPEVSILAVTGSPRSHLFELPGRFDYVKLPSASKGGDGAYCSRSLPLDLDYLVRWRSQLIRQSAAAFRPDVVLADHTPTGLGGELLPLLDEWHGRAILVLGLRDIIDDPARVRRDWDAHGTVEILRRYYDSILYYGDRRVFDPVSRYALPADVERRLVEVGYISRRLTPAARAASRGPSSGRPFVVVTVGGGGDGNRLLKTYLRGLSGLGADAGFDSLLITGPLMSRGKREKIRALAANRFDVTIVDFEPDLARLYGRADLVVCMGGYNTVVEVMACGIDALVVPRVTPRVEQLVRARCLARQHAHIELLHPDDMGRGRLAAAVVRRLDLLRTSPRLPRRVFATDGAGQVWRALQDLFARRYRAGTPDGRLAAGRVAGIPGGP
ncbi:MAG: glycosyltransferase family protein [Acidobacteriota bacterium]